MTKNIEIVEKQHFLDNAENGYLFFEAVMGDLKLRDSITCENTYNPFYDDTKPSLSIYFYDGMWRFKDHGDESYYGDVFTFGGHLYGLDVKKKFRQILHKMYDELGIEKKVKAIEVDDRWFEMGYKLSGSPFSDPVGTERALEYFKCYGITQEILKRYHVRRIDSYKYVDKNGNDRIWQYKNDEVAIAYEDVNHVKIYHPGKSEFKFLHRGTKPPGFVFGQSQIIRDMIKTKIWLRELLIITGGEKDVMSLANLGYDAISFNSETGNMPKQLEDSILNNYKYIVVMYDLDSTGMSNAKRLQKLHGFKVCTLPEELKMAGGKDVSDYFKLGLSIEGLRKLLMESISKVSFVFLNGKISERIRVESGYVNSDGIHLPFERSNETREFDNIDKTTSSVIGGTINDCNMIPSLEKELSIPSSSFEQSPFFPEEVFESLPLLLSSICSQFTDRRERDMILLSSLTVLSSLMPNVRSVNNGKEIGTNINVMITAPAASGKGVNNWAKEIAAGVKTFLKESYSNAIEAYMKAMAAFKLNQIDEEPQKPIRRSIFIPANNSVSNIYKMIEANKDFGIIFETEGDTLTETLKSDWGHFSDVIRKCFHHETISLARKTSDEFIEVDKPHLSIFLTGTPDQVSSLIKSVENGFFSRFAFYSFESPIEWKSPFKHRDNEREHFFTEISGIVFEYWQVFERSDNMYVVLTDQQIQEVDDYFEKMQKEMFECFGSDIVASVNRSCLIWQRLTMILTTLRTLEHTENLPANVTVNDLDARTALLVINALLTHLKSIFERVNQVTASNILNAQQLQLWNGLPIQFTRNEFNDVVQTSNIMGKTGEKYINDFIKKGLLKRIKHGEYCKIS